MNKPKKFSQMSVGERIRTIFIMSLAIVAGAYTADYATTSWYNPSPSAFSLTLMGLAAFISIWRIVSIIVDLKKDGGIDATISFITTFVIMLIPMSYINPQSSAFFSLAVGFAHMTVISIASFLSVWTLILAIAIPVLAASLMFNFIAGFISFIRQVFFKKNYE